MRTLLVTLLLLASSPNPADEPTAPVKAGYELTQKTLAASEGAEKLLAERNRLCSAHLQSLFEADARYSQESGEVGNLDSDPFLDGQDGKVEKLVLDVQSRKEDRAVVRARFQSFSPKTVYFRLIREKGQWVIDDIDTSASFGKSSLAHALSKPYPCGSTTKKPCPK